MLRPNGTKLSFGGELATIRSFHRPHYGGILFRCYRDRLVLLARKAEYHAGDLILKIRREPPGAIHGCFEELGHRTPPRIAHLAPA